MTGPKRSKTAQHEPEPNLEHVVLQRVTNLTPDENPKLERAGHRQLVQRRLKPAEGDPKRLFAGGEEGLLVGLLLGHELKGQGIVESLRNRADGETGRQEGSRRGGAKRISRNAVCDHDHNSNKTA